MILLALYYFIAICQGEIVKTVKTSQGVLSGKVLTSRSGRKYAAFSKIPFGKPPIGNLRFMPPEKADSWLGILDATLETPSCLQHPLIVNDSKEDCLYLNVYTPNVNASLPVIFYIFGGAFTLGEAVPPNNNAFLLDEDVVVVTPNHRLGMLGFLSLGTNELPGNMALKDLLLALAWTQTEIASFGGNPNLITALGFSSGAALAHYLCSSPRAKGLLKGCISLSGVGGAPWTLQSTFSAKVSAYSFGILAGCMPWNLLPCLQAVSGEKLVTHLSAFRPVIEPPSLDAVITEWPSSVNNFAWLTGHTANEGLLFTGFPDFASSRVIVPLLGTFVYYLRYPLRLFGLIGFTDCNICRIYDRFLERNDFLIGLEKLLGEYMFVYPSLREAKNHNGPKYFYVFSYTGGPSLHVLFTKQWVNVSGSCHGDDFVYFSNDRVYEADYKREGWPSEKDIKFSKSYVKMLVTFAREQTPSYGSMPLWMDFSTSIYNQLDNNGIYSKKYSEMDEIIEFWDSLS